MSDWKGIGTIGTPEPLLPGLGLGPDIEEVYSELGVLISIVNRVPIVVNQKLLYDVNAQGTKPFIREHHLDCTFPYNTPVVVGDILRIEETSTYHMVMNKTPELFENKVVEYSGVIYLCNLPIAAHIIRPIEIRNKVSYNMISGWHLVADAPLYGLLSDRIFGSNLEAGVMIGQDQIWRMDLYIPKFYDIQPLDRLVISPTEYYKVETIEAYNYPGVNVALLVEDTRPMHTMIDNEVYADDEYDEYVY